jgi:transposase InsO family protein
LPLACVGIITFTGDSHPQSSRPCRPCTTIGLYKTEKINRRGPWRTLADVEIATLEWVDWYNTERLHSACDRRPPAEYDSLYLNESKS